MPMTSRIAVVSIGLCAVLLSVVAAPAEAATRVWTGISGGRWSDPANWANGVPSAGDSLEFPATERQLLTNDLAAGTVFDKMTVRGVYELSGNEIALAGGVSVEGADLLIDLPVRLVASQTWHIETDRFFFARSNVALSGMTLTIDSRVIRPLYVEYASYLTVSGGGTIIVNGDGGWIEGRDLSAAVVNNGHLSLSGHLSGAITNYGSLNYKANGSATVANYATLIALQGAVRSLATSSSATTVAQLYGLYGDTRLMVEAGALAGTLDVQSRRYLFENTDFVIISNRGSAPLMGIFNGVPDGAIVTSSRVPQKFRVSYVAPGRSVVLTSVGARPTVGISYPLPNQPGRYPMRVSVRGSAGTPTGTVHVYDEFGTLVAAGQLDAAGIAILTYTATRSDVAGVELTVEYRGDAKYTGEFVQTSLLTPTTVAIPTMSSVLLVLLALTVAAVGVARLH